ncbi:phosphatidylinositol kinase [Aureococcus anophagefferens]|nr:phosphatidylinositol kinase [Aureococcus anophagefferens]
MAIPGASPKRDGDAAEGVDGRDLEDKRQLLSAHVPASPVQDEADVEAPLLGPHLAGLLEDDEDEPAAAAMYAQSCAVALPAIRESGSDPRGGPDPRWRRADGAGKNDVGAYYEARLVGADVGPRRDDDDDFAGDAHRKDGRSGPRARTAARGAAAGEDYYARQDKGDSTSLQPPPFEGGGRAPWDGKRAEKKDDAKGSAPAGKPPRAAVSLKDDGYGVGGLDDEPPLLTKAKALTAPAALSETRLALILRATMLLRGALSDYLFLVVPALLKLADALGGAGAAESRAQSLLSWADHPESPGRHDFDDGGDAHSPRTVGHFSASYKKVVAPGNVSFADLAETGGTAAASADQGQRPFSTPALGPQWQARVVRCLRVVVGRRALARRRDLGARIARSLCRLLERSDVVAADAAPAKAAHGEALRDAARDALEVVRDQLGEELFAPFVGLATRCLSLGPRGAASPAALAWAKRDARTRAGDDDDDRAPDGDGGEGHAFLSRSQHIGEKYRASSIDHAVDEISAPNLQRAWGVSQRLTADDWNDWLRRLSLELLRESPSAALRSCATVAHAYPRLSRQLFQSAFVSCWLELDDAYRDSLVRTLETAFRSDELQAVAPDALQLLLELAEFMERDVDALPIDIRVLADLATKCRAYAKALHYKELEYRTPELARDRHAAAEALIAINRKLAQPEAALGVLHATRKRSERRRRTRHHRVGPLRRGEAVRCGSHDHADDAAAAPAEPGSCVYMSETPGKRAGRDGPRTLGDVSESWLGKLGSYEEALALYRRRLEGDGGDVEAILGAMKCLDALGEWHEACGLLVRSWRGSRSRSATTSSRGRRVERRARRLGGATESRGGPSPRETRLLMKAANVGARSAWALGRWGEMTNFVAAMEDDDASKPFYRAILALRSLRRLEPARIDEAVDLVDDARRLLHGSFAALVAESYKRAYGTMVTVQQLAELEEIVGLRRVELAARGESRRSGDARRGADAVSDHRAALVARWRRRLAGCPHDVAVWQRLSVRAPGNAALSESVLTRQLGFDPRPCRGDGLPDHRLRYAYAKHCHAAGKRTDALRRVEELADALGDAPANLAFDRLRARCLLRLGDWRSRGPDGRASPAPGSPAGDDDALCLGPYELATRLDAASYKAWHAWALVNYRAVQRAARSPRADRKSTVKGPQRDASVDALRSPAVKRALVAAAGGFVRAIALGRRRWAASVQQDLLNLLNLWFRFARQPEVEAQLLPDEDDRGGVGGAPSTPGSASCGRSTRSSPRSDDAARRSSRPGRDLGEAAACLDDYERHARAEDRLGRGGDRGDGDARRRLREDADAALNQAWDLYYTGQHKRATFPTSKAPISAIFHSYYTVFRRVNKQLPQLTTLELRYVSPALLGARSLDLAVPGTYRVDGAGARIARFSPSVHVITSKQRPRRLAMKGEDGREYGFLLKGHEDLRQDERAMQLFGLANALLAKDRRTREHGHLSIQRYAVTPLSHNCGVVGWVPACDTLHALARDFRDARKIVLNVEHRVMLQLAPDYDALSLPQKVEVFDAALANTAGHDLSKVLWLKSSHSEQWLERRTHYARSLAAMSMVGHILGLGDRHPSNLMLDRRTGKVLHIDFGDCFEVAMHRDKFPERVPFRLTRMLVNAMEVSGVEGTYRATCERVMRVLRDDPRGIRIFNPTSIRIDLDVTELENSQVWSGPPKPAVEFNIGDNRDSLLSMLEAFIHDPLISWRLLGAAAEPDAASPSPAPGAARAAAAAVADEEGADPEGADRESADQEDAEDREGRRGPAAAAAARRAAAAAAAADDREDARSERTERTDATSARSDDDDDDDEGDDDDDDDDGDDDDDDDSISRSSRTSRRSASEGSLSRATSARSSDDDDDDDDGDGAGDDGDGGAAPLARAPLPLPALPRRPRRASAGRGPRRAASRCTALSAAAAARRSVANSRLDHRARESLVKAHGAEGADAPIEALNEKALAVMARVQDKLSGCDFRDHQGPLAVADQVDRLIAQSTDVQNLCQSFVGWCPFW